MRPRLLIQRISGVIITSMIILNLFISFVYGAMPLTDTIYTIPEGEMEFTAGAEVLRLNRDCRRETAGLGAGILSDISIWYSFQYLHEGIMKTGPDEMGDSFFRVWYYIGDYFEGSLHSGITLEFRIPTGIDAYTDSKWRNLSLGNNELKLGPVFQIDFPYRLYLHLNIFYVFRQGQAEGFYGGFSIDIFDKDTYRDLFGLNFQSEDSFMAGDRLKNDYAVFSAAMNSDILYPLIIFAEFYSSRRVYNKNNGLDELPIEGGGINPVLVSAGCRFFFRESIFLGLYYIINPQKERDFIQDIFGFDFSLQF